MTITYAMTATILFIGLLLMLLDVTYKLRKSEHRKISIILIATTMFYVAMDCLWIVEYTSEDFNRGNFVIFNTLFYLVYITMPYMWFLFAKHFSDSHLNTRKWNIIFALPWIFNLVLVILTVMGQDLLWTIGDAETRYTRGPLFDIFTDVCMFYYFFAVAALIYILLTRKDANKRLLLINLGFSVIPAAGVWIYTNFIPVEAIYPFQPCCFFLGVMFAYIMILSHVHQQAEEENIRLVEESRAAGKMAELMGSVAAILTNMPAMTFSKDISTGKYLACNQSFAEYAHKATPEGVVGLTDHEIFDKATADHFVEDDQKALSMDGEAYVFFEDVPDAGGVNILNLQTTKITFTDDKGRLCLLGMCVDVTEMTRIKSAEAEARAKQEELEHRIALQDQILKQEKEGDQQIKLITALSSDYWSVYYIELDKNHGICYQAHSDVDGGFKVGEEFPYLEAVTAYANANVTDEYREEFLNFIQPDNIRAGLKENRVIQHTYMVFRHGRETYEMVRFAGVRHPEDRDDNLVHAVGACFVDVDKETRKQKEQNDALTEALAQAKQANLAKTAFLSNMSHEIRTPMNAIIGLNNIALNDPDTSEKTKEYLDKIGSSAKHLLEIINDILDMSRIESGKMVIKNEEFSFSKALEQVNTIISGQCRDKDISYECHIKGKIDDYYVGDDMKLRQVMINILGNAVKFTPEGGDVSFTIEEIARFDNKSTFRFVIKDTGIGMSKDYLPHIFDAFSQEDASTTSKYGSTGLGMPITKSIVELMNGHIEVESEKDKGTTFTVTVTLTDSPRKDEGSSDGDLKPHEMSVLVIDDDPIACEHAQVVLGQVGVSCDTAASGAEGLEMVTVRHARRDAYDLILVDWKMPEMDGVETSRKIREVVGHDTAIIILTSYNWDDIADEAKNAGVDSFVSKPLFAATVMDEFREAFARKNEALARAKVDLKGRRILLAEDVVVNAEIMVMVLSMREMDVDVAENGRIAVDLFTSKPEGYYDAILMDMRMPEMDGLEATRTIRGLGRADSGTVPIIALTANAFDEDVQRSMQAGLNAHLSKPVEPEALFETLQSLIK